MTAWLLQVSNMVLFLQGSIILKLSALSRESFDPYNHLEMRVTHVLLLPRDCPRKYVSKKSSGSAKFTHSEEITELELKSGILTLNSK